MTPWYYNGIIVDEPDKNFCGFIYIITNNLTQKQYIGKKLLWFKKTKQLKGKKKSILVESDWKIYWSSSDEVKNDVKTFGEENFQRNIIRFCKTKGELSYWESKTIFEYDALLYPNLYYNAWIMVRVRRSHLQSLIKSKQ